MQWFFSKEANMQDPNFLATHSLTMAYFTLSYYDKGAKWNVSLNKSSEASGGGPSDTRVVGLLLLHTPKGVASMQAKRSACLRCLFFSLRARQRRLCMPRLAIGVVAGTGRASRPPWCAPSCRTLVSPRCPRRPFPFGWRAVPTALSGSVQRMLSARCGFSHGCW